MCNRSREQMQAIYKMENTCRWASIVLLCRYFTDGFHLCEMIITSFHFINSTAIQSGSGSQKFGCWCSLCRSELPQAVYICVYVMRKVQFQTI